MAPINFKTKVFILILHFSGCHITIINAETCKHCKTIAFGTESQNLTYGPDDEVNCNCKWELPTSQKKYDTSVVLLLQNVSLPMTSGSGGSTDCSASMRFPTTSGYKCNFEPNFCLVFATSSTICTLEKIKMKIGNENGTRACKSITEWGKAGGSPIQIFYNAGNFAGYTKYFVLRYLVISCLPETTTSITTEMTTEQTTTEETTQIETTISAKQTHKPGTKNAIPQNDNGENDESTSNPSMIMIIAIVSGGVVLLVLIIGLVLRSNANKKNSSKILGNTVAGNTNNDEMVLYEGYENKSENVNQAYDNEEEIYGDPLAKNDNWQSGKYTTVRGNKNNDTKTKSSIDDHVDPQSHYDDNLPASTIYDDNVIKSQQDEIAEGSPEYADSVVLNPNKGNDIYAAVRKK